MSRQCFFLLILMSHFVGILLGPPCYSPGIFFFFFFGLNLCSVLLCVLGPSSPRRSPLPFPGSPVACSESVFLCFSPSCCLSPASCLLARLGLSVSLSLSRVSVPVSASAPA